jgi:hypothetical protein
MRRLFLAFVLVGCLGDPKVVRVYDGRIVEGEYIPSDAYAAYLKGVLAEEAGDLRSALGAYEVAAREDGEDPEPFVRVGDVRCRLDPKSNAADEAFEQARRIDASYAPAIAAQARCASARGRAGDALVALSRVRSEDRRGTTMEALFVTIAASAPDGRIPGMNAGAKARERAIALTLASGDEPAAWDALIAWGRGKRDAELLARGLEGLLLVAPARSKEIEAGAMELLGIGRAELARRVAAQLADAPSELGVRGPHDPTVARLAIDEAIVSGDAERASRRAICGRVPLAEVAARALILERQDLARTIAQGVAAADPSAGCANMVLLALAARGVRPDAEFPRLKPQASTDRPAAACVLVVAERLVALSGLVAARLFVSRAGETAAMAPHDPVTGPLAVDLAARGVVNEAALPLELRLELAARRREPPPPVDTSAIDKQIVDAKHALLWHLLVDPTGTPAKTLLGRMFGAADRDPIIGYALARAALASGPSTSEAWASVLRAVAASPSDPLLLAVAIDLAKKGGRAEDIPPARARLLAVAQTPAERALARE